MKLLPFKSVAKQIVASVKNPRGLLTALTEGNLQKHTLLNYEAEGILDFFFQTVDCRFFASSIRSLPFFERPDGSFMAVGNVNVLVCLPENIPQEGLNHWSENRQISLLRRNCSLKKLYEQLGIGYTKKTVFYMHDLLPSIADLPAKAIPRHMEYIRDFLLRRNDGQLLHVPVSYTHLTLPTTAEV